MRFNAIDWLSLVLIIVGGLNWGLVGAFNYNLVDSIFGADSALSRIIYVLVGLSAVYMVFAVAKFASASRSEHRIAA